MSSYQWYRTWNGMSTDAKFPYIAKCSNQAVGNVCSVFYTLLDFASQNEDRGSIAGFTPGYIATFLGIEDADVVSIVNAMEGHLILNGRIKNWEKRQPECDEHRRDNKAKAMSNAERQRRYREKQKTASAQSNESNAVTNVTKNVTCNENRNECVTKGITARNEKSNEKRYAETSQRAENKGVCSQALRNVTKNAPDKDTDKDKEKNNLTPLKGGGQGNDSASLGVSTKPRTKSNRSADNSIPIVALPDWLPVKDWERFVAYRQEKGKPLTRLQAEAVVESLQNLMTGGHAPADVLRQSISNDWAGVFPIRGDSGNPQMTSDGYYLTPDRKKLENAKRAGAQFVEEMNAKLDAGYVPYMQKRQAYLRGEQPFCNK